MKKMILILLFIFWLFSLDAYAEDEFGAIDIHGFISQGYVGSDEYDFYLADTSAGTFEFNEVGINFSTDMTDDLRLGMQFLARDLGEIGNDEVAIDWAYADYRFRNWLGLIVGKVKKPVGLYNQSRDVDSARTSIFLPAGFYNENFREAILTTKGAGLYGTLPGHIDYIVIYGIFDVPLNGGITNRIDRMVSPLATVSVKVDPAVVGALYWDTPLDGLRLGAGGGTFNFTPTLSNSALSVSIPMQIKGVLVNGSIEYTYDNFIFTVEYMIQNFRSYMSGIKQADDYVEDFYIMASYRFAPWFQLGSYFSWHFMDRDNRNGKKQEAFYRLTGGMTGYKFREEAWLKEFVLTARFDILESWVLKLEGHLMNGLSDVPYDPNDRSPDLIWILYAAKLSYNF